MAAPPVRVEPEVRERIAAAARELFASQGYDRTTVDAIADRAGVGRRTVFRYFRSKDDAIFPDHDAIAARLQDHLAHLDHLPPLRAVCSGARLVFRSYVDDPAVALQRYRVAGAVPALRDREIAGVSRYTRLFARYLRSRRGDGPGVALSSDVAAAAVVAAHNSVLREWLRSGGAGDPLPSLEEAFDWVLDRFEPAGS